jgi:GTP-binding protein
MLPVIAIVGRPNVGKSTLFNSLTRTRDALVADEPGLTRDRQYGLLKAGGHHALVVDTGGLSLEPEDIAQLTNAQVLQAIEQSDMVLFMVDARTGLTAADIEIAERLRPLDKTILVVANKIDGLDPALALNEFYALGLSDPWPTATAHGRGIQRLTEAVLKHLPPRAFTPSQSTRTGIRVAIVGRPNVGKSTLINRLVGQERVVAHARPGTTRDSIYVPFERNGTSYVLIDTAGIRRRGRATERIERFSVIKSLQAIESAHVVVLMVDAREGVTDQDAHLLGLVLESGRALVLAVNKWDGLSPDQRRQARESLARKLTFVDFTRPYFISALHGSEVGSLLAAVHKAWGSAVRKLGTPELTRLLMDAVHRHPPPMVHGHRIKLRFAHQGGRNPPCIVIHGNQTDAVPEAYRRYLIRCFRKALQLEGTPIRLEFKTTRNPYRGRKNVLTQRQWQRRQRVIQHARERR